MSLPSEFPICSSGTKASTCRQRGMWVLIPKAVKSSFICLCNSIAFTSSRKAKPSNIIIVTGCFRHSVVPNVCVRMNLLKLAPPTSAPSICSFDSNSFNIRWIDITTTILNTNSLRLSVHHIALFDYLTNSSTNSISIFCFAVLLCSDCPNWFVSNDHM